MKKVWIFLCIFAAGAAVLAGAFLLNGQRYYLSACLILLLAFAAMLLRLERRHVRAREMVILAIMTALAVTGRAAFFLLPQVKPSAAVIILAGALLGAEPGFLIGAMTGFVSNFFFGQGPWTPFQMFGFGLIGLLAGLIFKKLPKNRFCFAIYGALSVFFLYGPCVNLGTFLTAAPAGELSFGAFAAVWASALWFDFAHAASTAVFLFLLARPFTAKLLRIRKKYGVFECDAFDGKPS